MISSILDKATAYLRQYGLHGRGFFQAEQGTTGNDFATVAQEFRQNLLQVQQARLTVNQSDHVDAEAVLKLGEFVELV